MQDLDSFTLHNPKHKVKSPTHVLAAATANTDKDGKVWQSPFEWLNQAYGEKGIKTHWTRALAGNSICPVCHKLVTPHLSPACPLLKELNLKLVHGPALSSKATLAPAPAAAAPTPSSTPRGNPVGAQLTSGSATLGSTPAPSGLMALVALDYDLDNSFHWEGDKGDKDGVDYVVSKSNPSTSSYYYYPLCNHAWLHLSSPSSPLALSIRSVILPRGSSTHKIDLPKKVRDLISCLPKSTIFGTTGHCWHCFAVADTGATDHMIPDKPAFISYLTMSNLQVCMGNIAFIPVLG